MARGDKTAEDRANAAALKAQRLQDGKLARREYEINQSAVLTNMQRLRSLRLSRDGESPPAPEPKASNGRTKRTKK